MAAFNLEKETFVVTSAIIDLGVDSSRSIVYFFNGFIHKEDLHLILILFAVSFAGTFFGKKILNFFSQDQFKFITLGLILFIGIACYANKYGLLHLFFFQKTDHNQYSHKPRSSSKKKHWFTFGHKSIISIYE